MAHISGKAGQVNATGAGAATETVGIKSWTLDYTADTLETTDFDDAGIKAYIIGGSGWSGSFEGFKMTTPIGLAGAAITIGLLESQTADQIWTGSAYITGIHINTSHDGIVSYSYDFQGTGSLTVAAA